MNVGVEIVSSAVTKNITKAADGTFTMTLIDDRVGNFQYV